MPTKPPFEDSLQMPRHAQFGPEMAVLGVLAAAFALYFVVRGGLNAAVVVLFLFCAFQLLHAPASHASASQAPASALPRPAAWIIGALAAPMVAVICVQLIRGEFVLRYFDAPLRLLMCGVILAYLVRQRISFVQAAGFVFPVALILCAALVFLFPGASRYFWDGRVATYFIDPLTLSQHSIIAGFLCLFLVDAQGRDPNWLRALKYGAFALSLLIAIGTGSRSGWAMLPVLAAIWFIGVRGHRSARGVAATVLGIVAVLVASYFLVGMVHERVDQGVRDLGDYFTGRNPDTSLGIRLSLYRTEWLLFLQNPLTGWGFTGYPDLRSIPGIAAFLTPVQEGYLVHSGGHNEVMQNMVRMGIFGMVSRLALFLVPLVVFARATRTACAPQQRAAYLGLVVTIGYAIAGLSTEVFNLIYAASFYGLLVAVFAAPALCPPTDPPTEKAR